MTDPLRQSRRIRFTMRTLLLVFVVSGILFAWWRDHHRLQVELENQREEYVQEHRAHHQTIDELRATIRALQSQK